ncbi:MAG: hypothetical protein DRJ05_10410 [Bacteroidetes bacterium]|nr:MAG: hypothetical protein DRJ05_10410 [Bacteroidota bacterium]
MKKLTITLALMVFVAFFANAQVSTSATAPASSKSLSATAPAKEHKQAAVPVQNNNPNAPDVVFNKTVHDYGTLEQHGDGKCEFKFTNEGNEPLILSNVRSSCGCTVPTWPREPILPGQSGVIKIKYDTKRIGTINKSIYVTSNAKVSKVTLKIKGKINKPATSTIPEKKVSTTATPVNK